MVPASLQGSTVPRETELAMPIGRKNAQPSARTVEDWVIWTYQAQQAHKVEDRFALVGQPMGHASRCSVSRVAEAAALGAIIGGSGRSSALHEDAELIHSLVLGKHFDHTQRGLIIYFGETGEAPDWKPNGLQIDRRMTKRGTPTYVYDDRRHPIACLVGMTVHPENLVHARSTYRLWWLSMAYLAELARSEGLRSCGDPTAEREPWLPKGRQLTRDDA